MKTSDLDILIVPGWSGSGDDHWQARWLKQLKTAKLVAQDDWLTPDREAWTKALVRSVEACPRRVLLVAHSLGCMTVAHAASSLKADKVAGAFLVAPADVEEAHRWPETKGHTFCAEQSNFAPLPMEPFPFPSVVVSSSDDPYCRRERAGGFALAWGGVLVDAGEVGHINVESGHGPWPEGLMRLGWFLKNLK